MKKVLVIGCPGSGKSTFSRKLHVKTSLPLIHLDMLYWNPDKTTLKSEEFLKKLQTVLNQDSWIIDGNYKSTLELRLKHCDTVFLLDYGLEVCLHGVISRIGSSRPDMPWIETVKDAAELSEYVYYYHSHDRDIILNQLKSSKGISIHIFKSYEEADLFLSSI